MNVLPIAKQTADIEISTPSGGSETRSGDDSFLAVMFETQAEDTVAEIPENTETEEAGTNTGKSGKSDVGALYQNISVLAMIPADIPRTEPEADPMDLNAAEAPEEAKPILPDVEYPKPSITLQEYATVMRIPKTERPAVLQVSFSETQKMTEQVQAIQENKASEAGTQNGRVYSVQTDNGRKLIPSYKVISILESNKETDFQFDNPAILKKFNTPEDENLMARMPHEANLNGAAAFHKPEYIQNTGSSDDMCPLENENDLHADPMKTTVRSGEYKNSAENGNYADDDSSLNLRAVQGQQILDISPEKLAAEQKFDLAAAESHSTENLFDTMVEKIEILKTDSLDKMVIRLKPEHLGKVTIRLISDENGLKVRIQADDPEVKNLINGHIDQLTDTLIGKGIKVSDMSVVYSGITDPNYDQSGPRRDETNRGRSRTLPDHVDALMANSMDQVDIPGLIWSRYDSVDMDIGISSVEYQA